jgi:hypothetical protein
MKKQVNVISRVLNDANKSKQFVGLRVRLKKDGTWRKVCGKVYDVKLSKDGHAIVVLENLLGKERPNGRKWQSVRLDRIEEVKSQGLRYKQ